MSATINLNRKLPNPGTQNRRVLKLLSYRPICPKDVGFTSRLAARINDLRRLGWLIESGRCLRHGHEGRIAEYRLGTE